MNAPWLTAGDLRRSRRASTRTTRARWQRGACRRAFLRYTGDGGDCTESRIRELDPARVAEA